VIGLIVTGPTATGGVDTNVGVFSGAGCGELGAVPGFDPEGTLPIDGEESTDVPSGEPPPACWLGAWSGAP